MARKKTYKTKSDKSRGIDPIADYRSKSNRIQFFNSLEEQEEDNYSWLASLSPEQHLYYATQLIKRIFANELKQYPTIGNRIKFDL